MPLKPGDPGYDYQSGSTPQTVKRDEAPVTSRPDPSGGGAPPSSGGGPRPPAAQNYSVPTDFYFHPSAGVGTMTGVWGDSRSGGKRRHAGQDIRMPMNTPLYATTSGTISHYANSSAGTVVYLNGDDGNKYSYFHLNSRAVANGARVTAGQLIARSGDTGNSSAPHLHFEYWRKGKKVDPRPFLAAARTSGGGPKPGDPGFNYQTGGPTGGARPGGEPVPDVDLIGMDAYYDQMSGIYGQMGSIQGPADISGNFTWADQLAQFQQGLANQAGVENPRKMQASRLMRQTLQGMSNMVKRDGYQSAFPSGGGGEEGNQVVAREEGA